MSAQASVTKSNLLPSSSKVNACDYHLPTKGVSAPHPNDKESSSRESGVYIPTVLSSKQRASPTHAVRKHIQMSHSTLSYEQKRYNQRRSEIEYAHLLEKTAHSSEPWTVIGIHTITYRCPYCNFIVKSAQLLQRHQITACIGMFEHMEARQTQENAMAPFRGVPPTVGVPQAPSATRRSAMPCAPVSSRLHHHTKGKHERIPNGSRTQDTTRHASP